MLRFICARLSIAIEMCALTASVPFALADNVKATDLWPASKLTKMSFGCVNRLRADLHVDTGQTGRASAETLSREFHYSPQHAIAVQISGSTLKIVSPHHLVEGNLDGDSFKIVKNDSIHLMATDDTEAPAYVSTYILNKETGRLILMSGGDSKIGPMGSVEYFECRDKPE